MSKQKPAVQFDRVSSVDQREGFSLDAQRMMGTKYSKEHGLKVVKAWAVDESASKEIDRKNFFEMIKYVKANGIQDIIFDKIDRACRGFRSAVLIEELIQSHNVRCHFARERLIIDETSPPNSKFLFYLGVINSKATIDNLVLEINKGLSQRREQGLWNSKAPFGYKNIRSGAAKKAEVVIDEEAGSIAKELFDRCLTGNYSYEKLAEIIRNRFPERTVSKRIVEEMLKNPFYYGYMKYKDKVIKGAHEPLIEKETWDACQRMIALRSANYRNVGDNFTPKPFMVMMTCGECGHAITGETKKKASGKIYIYYRCANLKCPQKRLVTPQDVILVQLRAAFVPFVISSTELIEKFTESLKGYMDDIELYIQQKKGEEASKLILIKKRLAKLEKMKLDGMLNVAQCSEVTLIKEAIANELKAKEDSENSVEIISIKYAAMIAEIITRIRNFMFKENLLLEQAELVKLVLTDLKLTNKILKYSYRKPFDVFKAPFSLQ